MEAYVQRMIDEQKELQERVDKLSKFLGGEIFKNLPSEKQELMKKQLLGMNIYNSALVNRLKLEEK